MRPSANSIISANPEARDVPDQPHDPESRSLIEALLADPGFHLRDPDPAPSVRPDNATTRPTHAVPTVSEHHGPARATRTDPADTDDDQRVPVAAAATVEGHRTDLTAVEAVPDTLDAALGGAEAAERAMAAAAQPPERGHKQGRTDEDDDDVDDGGRGLARDPTGEPATGISTASDAEEAGRDDKAASAARGGKVAAEAEGNWSGSGVSLGRSARAGAGWGEAGGVGDRGGKQRGVEAARDGVEGRGASREGAEDPATEAVDEAVFVVVQAGSEATASAVNDGAVAPSTVCRPEGMEEPASVLFPLGTPSHSTERSGEAREVMVSSDAASTDGVGGRAIAAHKPDAPAPRSK